MASNLSDCSNLHHTINDSHSHKATIEINNKIGNIIFDLKKQKEIYERKGLVLVRNFVKPDLEKRMRFTYTYTRAAMELPSPAALNIKIPFHIEKCANVEDNFKILENLDCTMDILNDDEELKLRCLLHNNAVSPFHGLGEEPLVNLHQINHSLHVDQRLKDINRINQLVDSMTDEIKLLLAHIQRKISTEKTKSRLNEEKICEQEARRIMLKVTMDSTDEKWKVLKDLVATLDKPKYTLEDMRLLRKEDELQKEKLAVIKSKLAKYEGLSPHVKAAKKSLEKLEEELKSVNVELKERMS